MELDRDKAALIAKAKIAISDFNQKEVAKKIGVDRHILNMFLNRKLDLLPSQIEALFRELNIPRALSKLSAPASI